MTGLFELLLRHPEMTITTRHFTGGLGFRFRVPGELYGLILHATDIHKTFPIAFELERIEGMIFGTHQDISSTDLTGLLDFHDELQGIVLDWQFAPGPMPTFRVDSSMAATGQRCGIIALAAATVTPLGIIPPAWQQQQGILDHLRERLRDIA